MMIFWGIFCGFVLGSFWPGSGDLSSYVGAVLGFFAGLTLRWVVRREIRLQLAAGHEEIKTQLLQRLKKAAPVAQPASGADVPDEFLNGDGLVVNERAAAGPIASTPAVPAPPRANQAGQAGQAAPAFRPVPEFQSEASIENQPAPRHVRKPEFVRETKPAFKPAGPNALELALAAAKNWLLGGNTIVRVGLVILFIGLSFLARYAAVAGLFPVEFRLAAIAAAGIALLTVGFKKRAAKPGFALALQGAGVAVMYLTVFASFRLYGLVPPLAAFGLMMVVCALSCALALLQNSRALAVAAFAGGFAVPILLSTGQGSHVSLFSYYSVLNLAILFIAYKRSWRILNMVGFIATFGVATAWGALKYAPENYATAQPFLIGFVLIYVLTAILYARNTPTKLGNAVDSTLVFGTPLIGFGLQAGLVHHLELGTAFSALGFGALYLLLATVLTRRAHDNYRLLIECFIAIGVGFATLAVPLALDARWTSAVWALEGAGAFWVGMRQARWMPRAFGLLLQGVAAAAFLNTVGSNSSPLPFANAAFIGALLIALPAIMIAWWLRQALPHSESRLAKGYAALEAQLGVPVYLYGFVFWCLAWVLEISRAVPGIEASLPYQPVFSQSTAQLLTLLAVVSSAWLAQGLGLAKNWRVATWPSRVSLAVLAATLLLQMGSGFNVLSTPAWAVWPVALLLHYFMLRKNDTTAQGAALRLNHAVHVGGAWLVTVLLADGLWFWIGKGDLWGSAWASVVLLMSAIAVLWILAAWAGRASQSSKLAAFKWPLNPHAEAYFWTAAVPLAALVFGGALAVALHSSGRTNPLPYIPLLNPTDLTIALALGALVFWRRAVVAALPTPAGSGWVRGRNALVAVAALAFIALNTVWLRIAHHFFGVRWRLDALFDSFVVQTGYAILWTLLALSLMVIAHRRVQRPLWLVGAGLLGLVVLKLLAIDLSNVGGAERIIAFIAVGVLMLVVGYFAPLPPKSTANPGPDLAVSGTL